MSAEPKPQDITEAPTETALAPSTQGSFIPLRPGATSLPRSIFTMSGEHLERLKLLASMCAGSQLSYAKSGKNPMQHGDIFLIMLKGLELGMEPMAALASIDLISGTPCLDGQGQLALIYRSGLLEDIQIDSDNTQCTVTMKRKGLSPHTETFTMDMARAMKTKEYRNGSSVEISLSEKSNWKSMPAVMLKWRAVAACARMVFPDIVGGLYTQEEIGSSREDIELTVTPDGQMIVNLVPPPAASKPAVNSNGNGAGHTTNPAAAYLATDAGRARLAALLDELDITDYAPYLAALEISRFSETTLGEDDLHERIRDIHAALSSPAPEPITDLAQLHARCEAELVPLMTKTEIAKLGGIDDFSDLAQWQAKYGTLDAAFVAITNAFAKTLPPAKSKRAVDGPMWGDFDTHQINEDAKEFYNLTPERARELVGKDWAEFVHLAAAQAALRTAVQREVLPLVARKVRYLGQYTEFETNPKVRLYGRDMLRTLGDNWQTTVDAWESRKTYDLPEPLLVSWKPSANGNYLEVVAVSTLAE